jgi:hypothetical protein
MTLYFNKDRKIELRGGKRPKATSSNKEIRTLIRSFLIPIIKIGKSCFGI